MRISRWDAVVLALAVALLVAWVAVYVVALMLLPVECASVTANRTIDDLLDPILRALSFLMFGLGAVALLIALIAMVLGRIGPPVRGALLAAGVLLLSGPFLGTWVLEAIFTQSLLERALPLCPA